MWRIEGCLLLLPRQVQELKYAYAINYYLPEVLLRTIMACRACV